MKRCKNCSSEFEGKYCPECGQIYLERVTSKYLLQQILDAFDLKKGILLTIINLFLRPSRLINDYTEGKTKPLVNPIAFFIVVYAIFYIISETRIFGFELLLLKNQELETLLTIVIPVLITSILVGVIPYMKSTPVHVTIVNFYYFASLSIIFLTIEIADGFSWIYSFYVPNLMFFAIPYTIFYFGSIYKFSIHKPLTIAVVFIGINVLGDLLSYDDTFEKTEKSFNLSSLPRWIGAEIVHKRDKFNGFTQFTGLQQNPIISDLTNDKVRDAALMITDSLGHYYIAFFHFKEGDLNFCLLNDLIPELQQHEIENWKLSHDRNSIEVELSNQSIHKLQWNGLLYQIID